MNAAQILQHIESILNRYTIKDFKPAAIEISNYLVETANVPEGDLSDRDGAGRTLYTMRQRDEAHRELVASIPSYGGYREYYKLMDNLIEEYKNNTAK